MKEVPGSGPLNAEQQEWYYRRFGERYVCVQTTPFTVNEKGETVMRASRAERRRNKFRPNMEPRKGGS